MNKKYRDVRPENSVLRLDLHSTFHIIFLALVLKDYEVSEFA